MAARNENEIAVSIPLEDVEKIQIYLNKSRKALSAIISETSAAYAIRGMEQLHCHGREARQKSRV